MDLNMDIIWILYMGDTGFESKRDILYQMSQLYVK